MHAAKNIRTLLILIKEGAIGRVTKHTVRNVQA